MTPWLRATGLLIVVGAGAVVSPYGAERAYAVESSPSATASASASAPAHGPLRASPSASVTPSPSRAGSRAGEGRERPGRRVEPVDPARSADPDAETPPRDAEADGSDTDEAADVVADEPRTARPSAHRARQAVAPSRPRLQILPLGSGLVLVGLGLGLALLALRARRG